MAHDAGHWGNWEQRGQQHRGHGRGKGGWAAGHDPTNFQVPGFLQKLGTVDEVTVLLKDTRDNRITSPFQGFFSLEIADNANSSINVLTERHLVQQATAGFYFNLFANVTLNVWKLVIIVSVDGSQSVPCAGWDPATASALDHEAFRPFTWPDMSDAHPTVTDVKLRINGELLGHMVFTAYRSDNDMSVTSSVWNPAIAGAITADLDNVQIIVSTFQGYRVSIFSVEPGGRLYHASANGVVVATDQARAHVEIRKVTRNSVDAIGSDPDRLEMRFRDAGARLDVACQRLSVPSSWLVCSHISGGSFANVIGMVRQQGGRIEAPDHVLQLSQLAAIHHPWFDFSVQEPGDDIENGDTAIRAVVRTPANPGVNVHVVIDSRLNYQAASVVSREALALAAHDMAVSAPAVFLPPSSGMGSQVVAAPQGADNPAIAAGLPPLMISNIQYQPERARGHAAADPDYIELIENRNAAQAHEPVPLVRPSLDDRRQAFAKAKAPALPLVIQQARALGYDPTSLSAGTTGIRSVVPMEVAGIRYLAPPTAREMELRRQLNSLHDQLGDSEQVLTAAQGLELTEAQDRVAEVQQSICLAQAELFVALDDRQRQTVQLGEMAIAGSGLAGPRPRSEPSSYGPPIIEEVTGLEETF
jgi:hypothetical protein